MSAAAVIDEQGVIDDDAPAREADAPIKALDLVVGLGLHQPVGRAVEHAAGIVQVQQESTKPVELVGAHGVIDRQPAVRGLDRRRVDAELGRSPRGTCS